MSGISLNLFQFNGVVFVLVKLPESSVNKFVSDGQLDVEFLEESAKELTELLPINVTIGVSIVLNEISFDCLI